MHTRTRDTYLLKEYVENYAYERALIDWKYREYIGVLLGTQHLDTR